RLALDLHRTFQVRNPIQAGRPTMQSKVAETSRTDFDLEIALELVRRAIEPFPKAALFQLASEGFDSVFEQLAACIISIRTLDEVTIPTAHRLFSKARTPGSLVELSVAEIDRLIEKSTFHGAKAAQLREIAETAVRSYEGRLPCDESVLRSFRGVGPKCANLV